MDLELTPVDVPLEGFEGVEDAEATLVLPLRPPQDDGARVLQCAQRVHRTLGPGLEDFLYARALAAELGAVGIAFERDAFVEVRYREAIIGKRRVAFLLEPLAVDVSAERLSPEALRLRAAGLLLHRPQALALGFGGAWLEIGRADARRRSPTTRAPASIAEALSSAGG